RQRSCQRLWLFHTARASWQHGGREVALMPEPKSFALYVDDGVLDDLRQRLERTRWPDEPADGTDWKYGTDLGYLKGRVEYWATEFDWRRQEAALNAFPQYTAPVAGIDLHFVHVPGVGPS